MLAASIIFAVQAQGLDWKTRNETALASDLRERLRPSRSVPPPGKASVDVQFSLWRIVEVNTRTQTITVKDGGEAQRETQTRACCMCRISRSVLHF